MSEDIQVIVNVETKQYRDQFDDRVAGGKVEYRGSIYYWSAEDSNYGFGWEVSRITDEDWVNLDESECSELLKFIKICLCEHKIEYVTSVPVSEKGDLAS